MAKEGFDWIWCEHALTVGYRSSLTEIVQIIGRATRDAPGKTRARFTNLIAEPDASEEAVTEAVNDTLKAIAASLLMEQVLAPRFDFTPKASGAKAGFDYGENGYDQDGTNVGFNEATGQFHIEIGGLVPPKSAEAKRICEQDLNEVITAFVQDKPAVERGVFDEETAPEELTQVRMGKIIADELPRAQRRGSGGRPPARRCRHHDDPEGEGEDAGARGERLAQGEHGVHRRRAPVRHGREGSRHRSDRQHQSVPDRTRDPGQGDG